MKQDKHQYYHMHKYNAMQNATWTLINKKTGETTEHNYSEMSKIAREKYIRWHDEKFAGEPYRQDKLNPENISIRSLDKGGCSISDQTFRTVTGVGYDQILPEYNISCYGYNYQCTECYLPLDKIKIKENTQARSKELFCPSCLKFVEAY